MSTNSNQDEKKNDSILKVAPSKTVNEENFLPKNPIQCVQDFWNGIIVDPHSVPNDKELFAEYFGALLDHWKQLGRRIVWLEVPIEKTVVIPEAVKFGFRFHHVQKGDAVMMVRWLPHLAKGAEEQIPDWATSTIGAGAFVLNEKNEVLVVQEKYEAIKNRIKLPGGYVKMGEPIHQAAVREVFEECHVDCEFQQIVSFRHMHPLLFGASDFYFICLMKAKSSEITTDPNEIAQAKWMPLQDYINAPNVNEFNRSVAQMVAASQNKNQTLIQLHQLPTSISVYPKTFYDHYFIDSLL